jgi:hypothetical protein
MSAKIEKRIRHLSQTHYNNALAGWERAKPPFWRIIARRRWKKIKPVYEDIEKYIRKRYK